MPPSLPFLPPNLNTWTLEPPHSTPISLMIATAASRSLWYSLSVSVWAGATVIESPAEGSLLT